MITEAQVALVQSSFAHVLPIADTAGELLYGRIFTLAPETRSLFDDDIAPQASRDLEPRPTFLVGLVEAARVDHGEQEVDAMRAGRDSLQALVICT